MKTNQTMEVNDIENTNKKEEETDRINNMQFNYQINPKSELHSEKKAKNSLNHSYSKGNNQIENIETTQPNENCSVIIKQSSIYDIMSQGEELQDILIQQETPTKIKEKLASNQKSNLQHAHTNNKTKSFKKKINPNQNQTKKTRPLGAKTLTSTLNQIKHKNKPLSSLVQNNQLKEDKLLTEENNKRKDHNKKQKMNQSMLVEGENDLSLISTPLRTNTPLKKNLKDPKFSKTYDRFAQKIQEHNNKLEIMKKALREQEEKCYRKIPMINLKSKKAISDNFYSRLEKKKQETENKKEQLRKIMEIEEKKKINKDRILPFKGNVDKADVNETIDKIMEWEKGRKERLEQQKKERLKYIMRQNKEKPTINRRSVEIAQRRYIDEDGQPFNRLYNEGAKLKERKKLLVELYTPSFKPKLNVSTYYSRRDSSYCDEVENTDFLTDNVREMFRDKIKSNRNRSLD